MNVFRAEETHPVAIDAAQADSVVKLRDVRKCYGDNVAVDSLDIEIRRGEFFTMLGPSGSGKTTTLRMIAGLETLDAGRLEIDGADVGNVPPYARNVNTVFQDYALFPHITVAKNLAYGLEAKRVPRADIARRVDDALRMVQLQRFAGNLPNQLSGGQRQRVALARAIINRPMVLLLDEPLGALDLKLRHEMQLELKRIQRAVKITFVYVTHDQEEAMTMSDRVAVFNQGRIQQLGSPVELYERPANEFVAGFLGVSNLLGMDGARVMIRPEKIQLLAPGEADPADDHTVVPATVSEKIFGGPFTSYIVELGDGRRLRVLEQNSGHSMALHSSIEQGARVRVAWHVTSAYRIPETPNHTGGGTR